MMGYPRDIDEYDAHELEAELDRRRHAVAQGLCPYCREKLEKHTCKMKNDPARLARYTSSRGDEPHEIPRR